MVASFGTPIYRGSSMSWVGSACHCTIVPQKVLRRLARDKRLPAATRKAMAGGLKFEQAWRAARVAHAESARLALTLLAQGAATVAPPAILVDDCRHTTSKPGTPVTNPGASTDAAARNAFVETTKVAEFYETIFRRNSVDGAGKALLSSIHFSVKYNNAFWDGAQMTYGDGDGQIFVDFTSATDVIAHELTHGVTQYTAAFAYSNQAGGLNESVSDVFGSMFRQWRKGQEVTQADWLIGADIMGPAAKARGYSCLRDMAAPAAKHCLSPQPTRFAQYKNGMDPHDASGIPNLAFHNVAMGIGGKSWEVAGAIWYEALTAYPASPSLSMKAFANRTRERAKSRPAAVRKAVDDGWKSVGL